MKTTKELLGLRIKELRKKKGLSQSELSEKIGVESKHLSRIEVGGSYPSFDTLEKTASALGVEMKDFFEFVEQSGRRGLRNEICRMLAEASPDELNIIFKIVRAIVR